MKSVVWDPKTEPNTGWILYRDIVSGNQHRIPHLSDPSFHATVVAGSGQIERGYRLNDSMYVMPENRSN